MDKMEQYVRDTKAEAMDEEEFKKRKDMQSDIDQAYLEGHINDDEHELDDEETRESINKAAKETVKKLVSGAKKEVESLAAKLSAN